MLYNKSRTIIHNVTSSSGQLYQSILAIKDLRLNDSGTYLCSVNVISSSDHPYVAAGDSISNSTTLSIIKSKKQLLCMY